VKPKEVIPDGLSSLQCMAIWWLQVRAAAVYALGTFVSSVTERSEHANNIDHSIAMTLINTVSHDMSPLVRKVDATPFFSHL
jgi:hypothetical protein